MKKYWMLAVIPGALAVGVGAFLLALLIVKALWAWTIPDLFPGAVQQGLIARQISWLTAFKVALFVGFIGAIGGLRGNCEKK